MTAAVREFCGHLTLRCSDCGWVGDQKRAHFHHALNPGHLVGQVVTPCCADDVCAEPVRMRVAAY